MNDNLLSFSNATVVWEEMRQFNDILGQLQMLCDTELETDR